MIEGNVRRVGQDKVKLLLREGHGGVEGHPTLCIQCMVYLTHCVIVGVVCPVSEQVLLFG